MSSIRWKDAYSVHDEEIDDHHKQLIRYIQALEDRGVREDSDDEFIQMVVNGLADYVDYHFQAEEGRMLDAGYPEYEQHKKEHGDFAKDAVIFREQWGKGSPRLQKALLAYLKDWLVSHILTSDKRLGEYLRAQRAND